MPAHNNFYISISYIVKRT